MADSLIPFPGQPYTVAVDTREQLPWVFRKSSRLLGVEVRKLDTGDYSLKGLESLFTIERKRSASEFSTCLFQSRFERELVRMDAMEHPYMFLEFGWAELLSWPENSGVPKSKWRFLRVTSDLLLKKYHEMRLNHPRVRVEFVGGHGREAALSLFKRIAERHGPGV